MIKFFEIVSFVVLVVLIMTYLISPTTSYKLVETYYIVGYGDSLWSIAAHNCPENMDIWEYIDKVRKANNVDDCVIYPGQVLLIYEQSNYEEGE